MPLHGGAFQCPHRCPAFQFQDVNDLVYRPCRDFPFQLDCLFQDLLKVIRKLCGMLFRTLCRFQSGKSLFFESSFITVQAPQGDPVPGCDVLTHLETFCRIKGAFQ